MTPRGPALAVALLVVAASLLGAGCAGKKQDLETMAGAVDAEQLFRLGLERLNRRDLRKANLAFERIEYELNSEERRRLEPLTRAAVADATFYQGTDLGYIDSRLLYLSFISLYGNHALAPYAQTQVGYCSLEQVTHPSKDQTQTVQAIQDLQIVIRQYPDSPFADAAKLLIREAESNLAESEFIVGKFYLERKAYDAAAGRFREMLERYPDYNEIDKVYFHLGQALLLSGDVAVGRPILDGIVERNPEGPWARKTRKFLDSKQARKLLADGE